MISLQEKIIKSSLITIILTFLGATCAYFVRILFSNNLSVEQYGLFYAVFGLFNIATVYMDLGFGYSIVYLIPKYLHLKDYSKSWNIFIYGQMISLTMSLIISVILIFAAPYLAKNYFKVSSSQVLIYIFCIYLIATAFINGLIQIYSALQKEKYYSSITVVRWLLTLVFSYIFLMLGYLDVVFFAIAWVLGHTVTAIFFLILLIYNHSFLTQNKVRWESTTFKQMFSFALPFISEIFVGSFMLLSDTLFLTLFRGIKEVGIYNIIYPIAFIPVILIAPINTLLLPLVSHLMEAQRDKMGYLMEKILILIPFVGLFFSLFIMMFPSSVVGLIFGQKWQGLVETPLVVLSLGAIAILMNGVLGAITSGTGQIREKLRISSYVGLLAICLNIILIWNFGILGAVVTTTLAYLFLSILFTKTISNILTFKIPYRAYIQLLLFSISLYTIVKLTAINPKNLFELIVFGAIYTLIYALLGFVLRIYDKELILMIFPKKPVSNI